MRFRKKPIEIEAIRWTGENVEELKSFCPTAIIGWPDGIPYKNRAAVIPTLHGNASAYVGDWVIRGERGDFWPCNPTIFESSYEAVGA